MLWNIIQTHKNLQAKLGDIFGRNVGHFVQKKCLIILHRLLWVTGISKVLDKGKQFNVKQQIEPNERKVPLITKFCKKLQICMKPPHVPSYSQV